MDSESWYFVKQNTNKLMKSIWASLYICGLHFIVKVVHFLTYYIYWTVYWYVDCFAEGWVMRMVLYDEIILAPSLSERVT